MARPIPKTASLLGAVLPGFVLAVTSLSAHAQNTAQPQYQGMQPQLIQGVEDGFATGKPKIRHVYLAAPEVLAVVIDAQHLWSPPVQKYVPQPGDVIKRSRPQPYGKAGHAFYWDRKIMRNGVSIGSLAGLNEDYYIPPYHRSGEALDTAWAEKPTNYSLSSRDDAAFRSGATPTAVYRKSKPEILEWTDNGTEDSTAQHEIFLRLPRPLTPGKRYVLNFAQGGQFPTPVSFLFDDKRLRTEAIEVMQSGYHPRQQEKVARVFEWLGSGGGVDFSPFKSFLLVDDKTGATRFQGAIKLIAAGNPNRRQAPERTADADNDLPAPLYRLDFSAFSAPGVYRVVVPGLGSSFPFRIDENVWVDAAKVSATGYLNQRSGIALGPPYTRYKRPRNLHPADGVPIYETDPTIYFATAGSQFKRIQASILEDRTNANAWGGWHDAGDYDRDILPQPHVRAVQAMLDTYESNPAYFEKLNLNLPESGNAIPDIMDEALWCMDLFLRIQQPDGGVPSAVESIEHPSEPSWLLKQPTAVTPPTPATCYYYAAGAAQMSLDLQKYDTKRAAAYRDSALRAMAWAEKNTQVPNIFGSEPDIRQYIQMANFHLYRLTGDGKWHDAFKRWYTEKPSEGDARFRVEGNGPWPVVEYALLPTAQADPVFQAKCRKALLAAADRKAADTARWAVGLAPQRYNWDERLGVTWELMAAHRLTGDGKYLLTMERMATFALGLNPSNTSYTTGIGSRQVVPFHLDARYLGVAYPEGISTLGPGPRNSWRGAPSEKRLNAAGLYPAWENWPWAESNFNFREPSLNEHVVGGNMPNILMTRAYLAQALSR